MSIYQTTYNIEEIIYEDRSILVCRKEAGLPVQSARMGTMDLESILKNHIAAENPGQMPYLGVVHRLDQPVEGILVFGKTSRDTAELNKQMAKGIMEKRYLAVTCGIPEQREGTFTDYLKKDGRQNTSCVVGKEIPGAKKAVLDYKVLEEADGFALVEILLHTGRHHQIRVQFAHHKIPLLGDRKYGGADQQTSTVALCAYSLKFNHPKNKKKMDFITTPKHEAFQRFSFCKSIK